MRKLIVDYVAAEMLKLHAPTRAETARTLQLMERYKDRPMDLADASLVALAEAHGHTRIFSIGEDFYIYRLADGTALEVLPGPMTAKRGRR